jgi:hypothetical protein
LDGYPLIILPKTHYKRINCSGEGYYIIRHFDVEDDTPIFNELNQINADYICKKPTHIYDLSTSLYGHFEGDHCTIKLTPKGASEFGECQPDYPGTPLVLNEDYQVDNERKYWLVDYSTVNQMKVSFVYDKVQLLAESYVAHTPMKWNFWHHSIRWKIGDIELYNTTVYSKSKLQNLHKLIGAKARSIIAQSAVVEVKVFNILPEELFCN